MKTYGPIWETHFRMGKIDESIDDFNMALKSNPNFPLALKGVGDSAMTKKDYETAANSYRSYLNIFSDDPVVWALLGQALEAIRDFAAARQAYEKALGIQPGRCGNQEEIGIPSQIIQFERIICGREQPIEYRQSEIWPTLRK